MYRFKNFLTNLLQKITNSGSSENINEKNDSKTGITSSLSNGNLKNILSEIFNYLGVQKGKFQNTSNTNTSVYGKTINKEEPNSLTTGTLIENIIANLNNNGNLDLKIRKNNLILDMNITKDQGKAIQGNSPSLLIDLGGNSANNISSIGEDNFDKKDKTNVDDTSFAYLNGLFSPNTVTYSYQPNLLQSENNVNTTGPGNNILGESILTKSSKNILTSSNQTTNDASKESNTAQIDLLENALATAKLSQNTSANSPKQAVGNDVKISIAGKSFTIESKNVEEEISQKINSDPEKEQSSELKKVLKDYSNSDPTVTSSSFKSSKSNGISKIFNSAENISSIKVGAQEKLIIDFKDKNIAQPNVKGGLNTKPLNIENPHDANGIEIIKNLEDLTKSSSLKIEKTVNSVPQEGLEQSVNNSIQNLDKVKKNVEVGNETTATGELNNDLVKNNVDNSETKVDENSIKEEAQNIKTKANNITETGSIKSEQNAKLISKDVKNSNTSETISDATELSTENKTKEPVLANKEITNSKLGKLEEKVFDVNKTSEVISGHDDSNYQVKISVSDNVNSGKIAENNLVTNLIIDDKMAAFALKTENKNALNDNKKQSGKEKKIEDQINLVSKVDSKPQNIEFKSSAKEKPEVKNNLKSDNNSANSKIQQSTSDSQNSINKQQALNNNKNATPSENQVVTSSVNDNNSPAAKKENDSNVVNSIADQGNSTGNKNISQIQKPIPQGNFQEEVKTVKQYHVIDELSKFIESGDKKSLTLKITPENLGEVKLVLDVVKEVVHAKIEVQNESVQRMVQNNMDHLKQSLVQSGLQAGTINITLTNQEQKFSKPTEQKKKESDTSKSEKTEIKKERSIRRNMGYNTYEYTI